MNAALMLAQFIDSFVFLYFAELPDVFNSVMPTIFKTEEKKYVSYEIEILGRKFKVQQKLGRAWPIFMKSEDNIEIKARMTHPKEKAGMEIKIPKNILYSPDPFAEIEKIIEAIIQIFGAGDFPPSRIDLCRHLQMPRELVLTESERSLFTGLWRNYNSFYSSFGTRRDRIIGYRFGSFKSLTIYFKMYLKLEEVAENNSFDPRPYYSVTPDPDLDVITFEATYESQFLRGRQINSIGSLKASIGGLWEYATHSYIVQRESESENKNLRKRGMSELWEVVASPWIKADFESLPDREKIKVQKLVNTLKKKKKLKKVYDELYGENKNSEANSFQQLLEDPSLKRGGK